MIVELNNKYGAIFSDSQVDKIINLEKSTKEMPEIKDIVNLSNTEEDCLRYILSSLNESLSENYIEDIDFYKKIEDSKVLIPISKKIYQDLISEG